MRHLVWSLAALGVLGGLGKGCLYYQERDEAERSAMWRAVNAVRGFQAAFYAGDLDRNGIADFWTADVAGLLAPFAVPAWDVDPRELAAADIAPLTPRAGPPRPFHGYYAVAVPCDPAVDAEEGGYPDFAICFYPARYEAGTRYQYTWYVTHGGRFKADTGGLPVRRRLPSKELRRWYRCC